MLLANGVEVEDVELDNIAMISKENKKEMEALNNAAIASLAWSWRNIGISTEVELVVAVRKDQKKGKKITHLDVLVSIDRMVLCVCVLLLVVNLYATIKINTM